MPSFIAKTASKTLILNHVASPSLCSTICNFSPVKCYDSTTPLITIRTQSSVDSPLDVITMKGHPRSHADLIHVNKYSNMVMCARVEVKLRW